MVEIYLNPEHETNWDEVALDQRSDVPEAVRASEKLLQEMPRSPRQQVLEAYPNPNRESHPNPRNS